MNILFKGSEVFKLLMGNQKAYAYYFAIYNHLCWNILYFNDKLGNIYENIYRNDCDEKWGVQK